jgi:hypothetical protein
LVGLASATPGSSLRPMEIAAIIGLAVGTLGASLLIVGWVGSRRRWGRYQTRRVSINWGLRLWVALTLLTGGLALLLLGPIQRTWLGGLFLVAFGGVACALVVRAVPGAADDAGLLSSTGELSPRSFDYVVWTSLGLVMLSVVLAIVLIVGPKS